MIEQKLRSKGWEEQEIHRALDIIYSEHKKEKHLHYSKQGNRLLYWTDLFILTIGNLLVSVVLIPFLLALKGITLYLIIIFLSVMFGILFTILIKDIEHLEPQHHIFAAIYIPLVAVLTLYMMVSVANNVTKILKIGIQHNPTIISIIYAIFFALPYIIMNVKNFVKKKEELGKI